MATETNTHQTTETSVQQIAVGILADTEQPNEVAGAILRAQRAGYDVLVCPDDTIRGKCESIEFAKALGATVVDIELQTDTDRTNALAEAARNSGYQGVFYQPDPTTRVDFTTTEGELLDGTDYVVRTQERPPIDTDSSIVAGIPAYNEASTIGAVVSEVRPYVDEVIVVDDGSQDETVEKAVNAGATVIEHEENKGYGGTLQTLFNTANRAGTNHLVILDGDNQHDASDVPKLVEAQRKEDAELVIGSRFVGDADSDIPLYRRFGLSVVNLMTNIGFGSVRPASRISDTQSGFRAYNREAIEALSDDESIGQEMGASTDILYHALRNDYDIEEVGTTIEYDVENASSANPFTHGLHLVSNLLQIIERDHPVLLLGVPGVCSALLGVGLAYASIANLMNTGTFPLGFGLASTFFVLAGTFACFTAIILHSLNQLHQ